MREFFKPWRKRIGVVTLVLACALMGASIRGLTFEDRITVRFNQGAVHTLISGRYGLVYMLAFAEDRNSAFYSQQKTNPHFQYVNFKGAIFTIENWKITLHRGFGYWRKSNGVNDWSYSVVIVPHWSIVIPLTALAAFLLLNGPKRIPAKSDLPAAPESA